MKPKDLKSPFKWEARFPCFKDGIVYVPIYYFEHDKSVMPELAAQSVAVEFCSGNGDWVIERAKNEPDKQWIAVEMQFCRVRKIWSKRENLGLKNLLIVCGKAEDFLEHYVGEGIFDEAYINFPDPWEKGRQAKHRIVRPAFTDILQSKMKAKGTVTLVTDHEAYADEMAIVMKEKWVHERTDDHINDYGYSFFADLFIKQQKKIRRQTYVNS